MDLENVYNRVDKDATWRVLEIYAVAGGLLDAIKSSYSDCV